MPYAIRDFDRRRVYAATGLVMVGIVAGNLSGFLREAVIASYFGATRLADIYLVAFTVPEFLFALLTVTISAALVPALSEHLSESSPGPYPDPLADRPGGARTPFPCRLFLATGEGSGMGAYPAGGAVFASFKKIAAALTLALALAALVGILAAPWYLPWLAPGFTRDEADLAARLSRIMFPAVVLWGLSAAVSAVLNVFRRFTLPALATAAYNTVFILVAVLGHDRLGLRALAWGVLLGAVAHLAIQLPQLLKSQNAETGKRKKGERSGKEESLDNIQERKRFCFSTFSLFPFLRFTFFLALGYALHHLSIVVDRAMASSLPPGSIAALNYAYRLPLIIGQVLGMAVATAFFPALSRQAVSGEAAELRETLALGLRILILLGLPAMAGLALLREPIIRLLFQRGAFDQQATALTATLLLFYTLGVFADMLCQPLWRALYALQKAMAVAWVNGLKTALRLAFNLAFIPLLSYNGIALSFSLGLTVQLLILGVLLSRRIGPLMDRPMTAFIARVAIASALMAAVSYAVFACLSAFLGQSTFASQVLLIITTALAGALIFVAAAHTLGIEEVTSAVGWVSGQSSLS